MRKKLQDTAGNFADQSFIAPPSSVASQLSAPGIHGECVPMRDLSREQVDFCIVGAGALSASVLWFTPAIRSLQSFLSA